MPNETTTTNLVLAAGAAIGFGVGMVVTLGAAAPLIGALAPGVVSGLIAQAMLSAPHAPEDSATALGRNHDICRLVSDSARQCIREWAERNGPLWQFWKWPERLALRRTASRLASQWTSIEKSSFGEACRSPQVVAWFQTEMTDASGIRAPINAQQWSDILSVVSPGLPDTLRTALAKALEDRFAHWVRQRFKDDFTGQTPAKGRAYAALQMATLGALCDMARRSLDLADHTRIEIEATRKGVDDLLAHAKKLADDPALKTWRDKILKQFKASGAVLNELLDIHVPRLQPLPERDITTEAGRFIFRNQRIDVFGRDDELATLQAWLDDDRQFSWDLWTGPAGAGKSRLALELCLRASGAGWRAGFYEWATGNLVCWDSWGPARDYLIVFDYLADHAPRIGDILRLLAGRAWPNAHRVRILLLEREIVRPESDTSETRLTFPEPAWLNDLLTQAKQIGEQSIRAAHRTRSLDPPETPIKGVSDDALAAIVRREAALHGSVVTENCVQNVVSIIKQIDPRARPLFAAMTAEAVREGAVNGVAAWNLDQLVQHILHRERARWTGALKLRGVTAPVDIAAWERLLCLATMCSGLDDSNNRLARAMEANAMLGLPQRHSWGDGSTYRLLIPGSSTTHAPPLEPDIIGEAFVLWRLDQERMLRESLIDLAWSLGLGPFLVRAAGNFPDHPSIDAMLDPARSGVDVMALAASHTARFIRTQLAGDAERLATCAESLASNTRQPPVVRALGAFAFTTVPMTPEAIDRFVDAFTSLVDAARVDPAVRERLASGLFNAIAHAGTDTVRADALLEELRRLVRDHPNDPAVREQLAKGLNNAIFHAGTDTVRADALLEELRRLVRDHPNYPAVREQLAKGLHNAIVHAGTDTVRADALLEELRGLVRDHPNNPAVRELLASGLNNAIAHAGTDTVRADALLEELRGMVRDHPNDPAVREQLASGLNNAIAHAGTDTVRADALLEELLALAEDHGDDQAVSAIAFRGCCAAFILGLDHDVLRVGAIKSAADVLPRARSDAETQQIAVILRETVHKVIPHLVGPPRDALDHAGARLWVAYRQRFPAP